MTVRELVAKFGLKLDESSFEKANRRMDGLKKAAVAFSAAFASSKAVQFAQRMVSETAAVGASLDTLAQRTGISVESLQELRHAAELSGVSVGDMDASLQRFNRRLGAAASGNKALGAAFARAGLRIRDASGQVRDADTLFMELADRMARLPSDAQRTALAMELFGDAGVRMGPLFKEGAAGIERFRAEARELGLMSAEAAKDAAEMGNQQIRLRRALSALRDQIVGRLLPSLNQTIPRLLAWMRVNRDLIAQRVERTVEVIASAMKGLKDIAAAVVDGIRWVGSALGGAAAEGVKFLLVIGALIAAFGLKAVAIGLAFAILQDFIVFMRGGESLLGDWVMRLKELREEFLQRDASWKESPLIKFLQELVKLQEKVSTWFANLSPGARAALSILQPGLALYSGQKVFEQREEMNRAPGEWAGQEEQMAEERRAMGLPDYAIVPPSISAGRPAPNHVEVTNHVTIEGSDLSEAQLLRAVAGGFEEASRDAFGFLVPAME